MERFSLHIASCPVCSSPVNFRSSYTNYTVCKTCNSSLIRGTGGDIESSPVPVLKNDSTGILHIGSHGEWKGRSFEVIGRMKCYFDGYHSNRWTISFMDGPPGLLVETDGFLAIYETAEDASKNKMKTLNVTLMGTEGIQVLTDRRSYMFDRSLCTKVLMEGEVYTETGDERFHTYELGDDKGRIEVLETKDKEFYCWDIHYCSAEYLKLSIPASLPERKPVNCAQCKKETRLLVPQYSRFFVCSSCKDWNIIEPHGSVDHKDADFGATDAVIPLGATGQINGITYKVTGITKKLEVGAPKIYWNEYTLFSIAEGFAFLSEFNGHWIFLQEEKLNKAWPDYQKEIDIENEPFLLYNDYSYKIVAAEGESCSPFRAPGITVKEFISPPEMYVAEKDKDKDVVWFKARHIGKDEVAEAFAEVQPVMPEQLGIGAVQPMPFYMNMGLLKRMFAISAFILLALQIFFSSTAKEKVLLEETYNNLADTVASKGITTPSFELRSWKSNLEFRLGSPVSNSWFEASVTLVNDVTGAEYNFEKGVEYYYGYTDGENWTEGSTSSEITLSSIPRGKYHLNIFPSFDKSKLNSSFSIMVINDVPMLRNFIIIILLLAIYPVVQWFRTRAFEKRRWYGSENNPYASDDED